SVPGVTVRGEDGFGLRPNIGIRGANSDRSAKVTLTEDGVLLGPAPYAAPAAYYFPMVTRMVGVEVFKGPAAIRFGPQTVGGAVNLLTRPIPQGYAHRLDVAAGLYQTRKVHGWSGYGTGRGGILVEGVHLRTGGFKELDGGDPDGGDTGFDRTEAMVKGRLGLSERHQLTLKLGYANETSNETYLGLSAADYDANPYRRYAASQRARMLWDRTQAELGWNVRVDRTFRLRTVAYHHYQSRAWTKFNAFSGAVNTHTLLQDPNPGGQSAVFVDILRGQEDSGDENQLLLIGTNDRQFHSYGVQSTARWSLPGEDVSSNLEAGVRVHRDDVVRIHTEDAFEMLNGTLNQTDDPTVTTLDSDAYSQAFSAHVQEDLRYKMLHLLPGARVEVIESFREDEGNDSLPTEPITRATVLPGLGVLRALSPWMHAFAGVHRGFSPVAPGQAEDVEAEVSWNYEGGLRFYQGDLGTELVGFFNDYTNISGACTFSAGCTDDLVGQQFNGGEAWIYGLEAVIQHTILLPGDVSVPLSGNYTYTETQFRTSFSSGFAQFGNVLAGDSLPYVPRHQGSGQITLAHPRFSVGVNVKGHAGMLDEAKPWPIEDTDVPALFLVDGAASVAIVDGWSAYVTATNLTQSTANTAWRPFGARPTAPLQAMVGVKWAAGSAK
ncbi:MAG: TonB-dependent receptor, partial [Myxococcota bacterium]